MNCYKCKKEAEQKIGDKDLCSSCFMRLAEKRIRKCLRDAGIKKGDKILVLEPITEHFIEKILTMPFEKVSKKLEDFGIKKLSDVYSNSKLKDYIEKEIVNTVIIPWTKDHEIEQILGNLLQNETKLIDERFVKIFKTLTQKNVIEISKKIKIKYKQEKFSAALNKIEELEEKYPGTKDSMLKSGDKLEEFL